MSEGKRFCCFVYPRLKRDCQAGAAFQIAQVRPGARPADACVDSCLLHVGALMEDGVDAYVIEPIRDGDHVRPIPMTSYHELVRDFMLLAKQPVKQSPEWDEASHELRLSLHREEMRELEKAMEERDLVETADAIADLIYVLSSTAHAFGIPLDAVFTEVHRVNMEKALEGVRRSDGKIVKGANYKPPDVRGVMGL